MTADPDLPITRIDVVGDHLDVDRLRDLARTLRRAPSDHVVVLVLGGSLTESAATTPEERHTYASAMGAVVDALSSRRNAVVTAATGPLAAGAVALLLSGDVVLLAAAADLTPFPSDLPPTAGLGWLLRREVGRQRAIDLAISARTVRADEARDLGLATAVVEDPVAEATSRGRGVAAESDRVRVLRQAVGGPSSMRGRTTALDYDAEVAAAWS